MILRRRNFSERICLKFPKKAFLEEYLVNYNGVRATQFSLPPVTKLEGKFLQDFEREWEEHKKGKL